MIIYLYGSDTQRSGQTLRDMKQKFTTERDPQGLNLVEFSVGDVVQSDIIEQLHVAPFLAEKRMLILKRLISDGTKELHSALLPYFAPEGLADDTIVVVWDESPKPRAKDSKVLVEQLITQPYSQAFEIPTGYALKGWITAQVQARGGTIESAATEQLSVLSGVSVAQLSHIIDQLVAYAAGRDITAADVTEFTPLKAEDNIFELVDTAISGNKQKAFTLLREQYRTGKDAHYMFAMLLRQYRIMLDIADILERRVRPDAKAMGLHPFVLKKTMAVVQSKSYQSIVQSYQQLLDIDIAIKQGAGNAEVLIDAFVGNA